MRPAPTPPRPDHPSTINDYIGQSFPYSTSPISEAVENYVPEVGIVMVIKEQVVWVLNDKSQAAVLILSDGAEGVKKVNYSVQSGNALVTSISDGERDLTFEEMEAFLTPYGFVVDDVYEDNSFAEIWPVCVVPDE